MCRQYPELANQITVRTTGCMRQCRTSPNCKINGVLYQGMTVEKIKEILFQMIQKKK